MGAGALHGRGRRDAGVAGPGVWWNPGAAMVLHSLVNGCERWVLESGREKGGQEIVSAGTDWPISGARVVRGHVPGQAAKDLGRQRRLCWRLEERVQ